MKCFCLECLWLLWVSVPDYGRYCGFFGFIYFLVLVCDVEILCTCIELFDTIILCTDVCVTQFSVLQCVCVRCCVYKFMCRWLYLFSHVSVYHPDNPSPVTHVGIFSKNKNHFHNLAFAAPSALNAFLSSTLLTGLSPTRTLHVGSEAPSSTKSSPLVPAG